MFLQTENYTIEFTGYYQNGGTEEEPRLCSGWEIILEEFPECPFDAEYEEVGEFKGDVTFGWHSSYPEEFKDEMRYYENRIKNAISFLNNNLI